jgi:hypothetical protein
MLLPSTSIVRNYPRFKNSTLMLLERNRHGAVLWTTPIEGTTRATPPSLGAATIAYSDGRTLTMIDRADGSVRSKTETIVSSGLFEAIIGHLRDAMTRNKPAFLGDSFYTGFESQIAKVDPLSGKDLWRKSHYGLGAFQNLTAGPIVWGDLLVFGNTVIESSNKSVFESQLGVGSKPRVFVADLKGDEVWNDSLDDPYFGVASLATQGERLFVATNSIVSAYDRKGHRLWEDTSADTNCAVTTSRLRGIKFYQGTTQTQEQSTVGSGGTLVTTGRGNVLGVRVADGFCMAADEKFVYVSSVEFSHRKTDWYKLFWAGEQRYEVKGNGRDAAMGGREVVTVLNADSGAYVTTLDAKGAILDLFALGGAVAVLDHDGVRFLRRPQ